MISFIIPTRNEEGTIENTLKCINSYSGEKEIIVSDGGSSDKTIEIARKYANKILIHSGPKRQNIPEGRNTGAKEAVGNFIVFIDADVTVPDMNGLMQKARAYFE
ncbi:MAG: glycosyltransferase, partial [bacterium]